MPTAKLLLAKIALGPLLLWQGRRVLATTTILPEPDGKRAGVVGDGPQLRLLIVGDSSGAGVGAKTQDDALVGAMLNELALGPNASHRVEYTLIAKSGLRTTDMLPFLHAAIDDGTSTGPFDVAITALGVNDVTSQASLDKWLQAQRALREFLQERFGVRHVVVSGVPPMRVFPALPSPLRWFLGEHAAVLDRANARALVHDDRATFLKLDFFAPGTPMAEDGFHPSPEVYRRWAAELAAIVRDVVTGQPATEDAPHR